MFSRKAVSALVAIASFAPFVAAHGGLRYAEIDGKKYDAPPPNSQAGDQFAIREIYSIDPVKGADARDLNCGQRATNVALVADANPGSVVKFNWANGEGGAWPHDTGPIITYMASCGAGGCANFDAIDAEFFKIDEKGRHPETGKWFQSDIFQNFDATSDVTLPTDLPAGEYLVRHEIIGLHRASEFGGAEFYPTCLQVRMSQGDTTKKSLPDSSLTVKFPGGYGDSDPGILVSNVYDTSIPYPFPGPELISRVVQAPTNPEESVTSSEEPAATSTTVEEPATTPALPPCGGYKKKMKRVVRRDTGAKKVAASKRQQQQHNAVAAVKREARPIVMSRVMRGIN
jgi:hypothetical protein